MSHETTAPNNLERDSCLARQEALRSDLREAGCAALLVQNRAHLTRLFNYRAREVFPAAAIEQQQIAITRNFSLRPCDWQISEIRDKTSPFVITMDGRIVLPIVRAFDLSQMPDAEVGI